MVLLAASGPVENCVVADGIYLVEAEVEFPVELFIGREVGVASETDGLLEGAVTPQPAE
jgi:hypothetical protein